MSGHFCSDDESGGNHSISVTVGFPLRAIRNSISGRMARLWMCSRDDRHSPRAPRFCTSGMRQPRTSHPFGCVYEYDHSPSLTPLRCHDSCNEAYSRFHPTWETRETHGNRSRSFRDHASSWHHHHVLRRNVRLLCGCRPYRNSTKQGYHSGTPAGDAVENRTRGLGRISHHISKLKGSPPKRFACTPHDLQTEQMRTGHATRYALPVSVHSVLRKSKAICLPSRALTSATPNT